MVVPSPLSRARVWLHSLRWALHSAREHRLRSALSVLGVLMGVTGLVVLSGLVEGLERAFHQWTRYLGPELLYVQREPFEVEDYARLAHRPPVTLEEADFLREHVPSARGVVPQYRAELTPTANIQLGLGGKLLQSGNIIGSTELWPLIEASRVREGRFLSPLEVAAGQPVVVVGADVAEKLREAGLRVGGELELNGQPLRVVGLMAARGMGLFGSLDNYVVLPTPVFERLLGRRKLNIGMVAPSPEALPRMRDETLQALRMRRGLLPGQENDFSLHQFSDAQALYEKLTLAVVGAVAVLALLTLLVSGGGIMNVMLVAAEERRREVGLLSALGARPNTLLASFLAEAALLTGLGAAGGVLLGALVTFAVGSLTPLEASLRPSRVALAVLYGVGVGVLFGLLPAYRASRLPPTESLRAD